MRLKHNFERTNIARQLRKNMTKEEKRLWYDFLKNTAVKFVRQKEIGHYFVDFYCSQLDLIIEIDGSQHYTETGNDEDRIRDMFLKEKGFTVLRYNNADINLRFESVCMDIQNHIENLGT